MIRRWIYISKKRIADKKPAVIVAKTKDAKDREVVDFVQITGPCRVVTDFENPLNGAHVWIEVEGQVLDEHGREI